MEHIPAPFTRLATADLPATTVSATPAPDRPFVLFAGAGVSAAPPACLPGWYALNDAILMALFDRTAAVDAVDAEQRKAILEGLRDLRGQHLYPPDYQADFLEEEAGLDYFRALEVLDDAEPAGLHRAAARMAARGELAAIVTTNFDRLFERALEAEGIAPALAYDAVTFEKLRPGRSGALPVIKVHGSVAVLESMIDTRKQRRRGRARALLRVLEGLFRLHPVIVAGFSGDDLETDPEYLGLRSARSTCPGLLWIAHPPAKGGPALGPGARALLDAYPTERARVVVCGAEELFTTWAGIEGASIDVESARAAASQRLAERLTAWAGNLDLPLAITMAAALLEAAGNRPLAHRLVRTGWNRGIDRISDVPTASRRRFLRAHARVRLRRGRYSDPDLGDTLRLLEALNDPLASALCFFGDVMTRAPDSDLSGAVTLLSSIELSVTGSPTDRVDCGLACAYAGTITDFGTECLDLLEQCRELARLDGDDVREALCAIEIAIRLSKCGIDAERAADLTDFASQVASKIHDGRLESGVALRNALALIGAGMPRRAEEYLATSFAAALADELRLHMARSAVCWLRLAAREGLDFVRAVEAFSTLNADDLGPLAADAELALAEYALRHGDPDRGTRRRLIENLARQRGLAWYAAEAQRIAALGSSPSFHA